MKKTTYRSQTKNERITAVGIISGKISHLPKSIRRDVSVTASNMAWTEFISIPEANSIIRESPTTPQSVILRRVPGEMQGSLAKPLRKARPSNMATEMPAVAKVKR